MEQYSSWMEIIKASLSENYIMYIIIFLTMATMQYLPKVSKAVPAGLVAIVVITLVVYFMGIDTKTVGQMADLSNVSFPHFSLPDFSILFSAESLKVIIPTAIIVALVGLIESLLTLSVLDEMGGERGSGNKECVALGCGKYNRRSLWRYGRMCDDRSVGHQLHFRWTGQTLFFYRSDTPHHPCGNVLRCHSAIPIAVLGGYHVHGEYRYL